MGYELTFRSPHTYTEVRCFIALAHKKREGERRDALMHCDAGVTNEKVCLERG